MRLFYLVLPAMLAISCGTRIQYIGNVHAPTDSVAVFVDEQQVPKPYSIQGKGYPQTTIGEPNPAKIQRKALAQARRTGADAIIIKDYVLMQQPALIASGADSLAVRSVTSSVTGSPAFQVLFIRYKDR